MGEREQAQPLATLEELLAERIAAESVRIAEEPIREMFEITEFGPDEVLGYRRTVLEGTHSTKSEIAYLWGRPVSRILLYGGCGVHGSRVMSENALRNGDFRGSFVEACRPLWGQIG